LSAFAGAQAVSRFALVIGNSAYEENALKNPVHDAELVASQLEDCGFDVMLYTDVTTERFLQITEKYAAKVNAAQNAVSLFYYSGHGVQSDSSNYLIPVDNGRITSETALRLYAFPLDTILSLVKAPDQILILDACRNNPFRETGTRSGGTSRGLSVIGTRKNTSLSYLFATQAGETADDGEGTNSLFTSVLVQEMQQMNVELSVAFNNIANTIKDKTGGKQIPLSSSTGTSFYFMDPAVADAQLKQAEAEYEAALQAVKDATLASANRTAAETGNSPDATDAETERLLAEQKLELMKQKKQQADEDAARKQEEEALAAQRSEEQKQRIAELTELTQKAVLEMQKLQSENVDGEAVVTRIEQNKQLLINLRKNAEDLVSGYQNDPATSLDNRIQTISDRPWKKAELTASGSPTEEAQRRRETETEQVRILYKREMDQFISDTWQAIKPEETRLIDAINADYEILGNKTFTATSLSDTTLVVRLGNYDGVQQGWPLTVTSSLFGSTKLFSFKSTLSYADVSGDTTVISEMTSDEYTNYVENVEIYDSLFRGAVPVICAELDYSVEKDEGLSTYQFVPKAFRILRSDEKKTLKSTCSEDILEGQLFVMYPQIDIRTDAEIAAAEQLAAEQESARLAEENRLKKQKIYACINPVLGIGSFLQGDVLNGSIVLSSELIAAGLYIGGALWEEQTLAYYGALGYDPSQIFTQSSDVLKIAGVVLGVCAVVYSVIIPLNYHKTEAISAQQDVLTVYVSPCFTEESPSLSVSVKAFLGGI
jgi:uncharacterized caspase-like protein